RSIVFEGRDSISQEKLLEVLGLRPGSPWQPGSEEESLRRLAAWPYLESVVPPRVTRLPDGSVDLVFPIKETLLVGTLKVEGNDAFRSFDLLAETGLRSGQPFHEPALREAEEAMLAKYHRDGFLLASVLGVTSPPLSGRVDLTFRVSEGRRVYV